MFVSQMNENCVYHIQKHFQFVFGTLFFIPLSLLLADIQSYFIGYTLSVKSLRTVHFSVCETIISENYLTKVHEKKNNR